MAFQGVHREDLPEVKEKVKRFLRTSALHQSDPHQPSEQHGQVYRQGMNAHVAKPVDLEVLMDTLWKVMKAPNLGET